MKQKVTFINRFPSSRLFRPEGGGLYTRPARLLSQSFREIFTCITRAVSVVKSVSKHVGLLCFQRFNHVLSVSVNWSGGRLQPRLPHPCFNSDSPFQSPACFSLPPPHCELRQVATIPPEMRIIALKVMVRPFMHYIEIDFSFSEW